VGAGVARRRRHRSTRVFHGHDVFVVLYMYNNIILSLIRMAGIFGIIESQLFDRINKK